MRSILLAVVPLHVLGDSAHVVDIVLYGGVAVMMTTGVALFVSGRAGRRDVTIRNDFDRPPSRTRTADHETSE